MSNIETIHEHPTCWTMQSVGLIATLKNGEWRILFEGVTSISADYLVETISEYYCLDEAVADRLEPYVMTYIGDQGNMKDIKLTNQDNILDTYIRTRPDKNNPYSPTTLNEINIRV